VHVRVDETGHEVSAGDVHALATFVATETDDVAVRDRYVDLEPFLGEDGEHAATGQHKVGRLVPPRDRYPPCVDDGQA
jgi:hypothetical protein